MGKRKVRGKVSQSGHFSSLTKAFCQCVIQQQTSSADTISSITPATRIQTRHLTRSQLQSLPKTVVANILQDFGGETKPENGENHGDYVIYKIDGLTWKVKKRYDSLQRLGEGSFGAVYKAVDTVTQNTVAIKRLNNPYQSGVHARRALRELKLLKFVKHENLISLVSAYTSAKDPFTMVDLYLITPCFDTNLYKLIQDMRKEQKYFSQHQVCHFMYQIVRGIRYLHSANILHRDLKTLNIIIRLADCHLKIIDFGLARGLVKGDMTDLVQTALYRAPEVLCIPFLRKRSRYTTAIDIWSMGCIFGEMFKGSPIFFRSTWGRGMADRDILVEQFTLCGKPGKSSSYNIHQTFTEFQKARLLPKNCKRKIEDFGHQFKLNKDSINFFDKLLQLNPNDRPSAELLLSDPYFEQITRASNESNNNSACTDPQQSPMFFDDQFEKEKNIGEIKKIIFQELQDYVTNKTLTGT